jgi:beta-glucosidase
MRKPEPWHVDGALHFALGVEDTFVPQSRAGERAIDEYELTEHYTHWHSDLGLARDAGATLLRWGIPWHRVNPERGVWEFAWLDRVMDRFAELELEPIVDLLHYGTPLWLDNQFANPGYASAVEDYAGTIAERYRGIARSYTPVNEPMIHAQFSGQYAYWPPYLEGQRGLATMVSAISRGFVLSQEAIASALGDDAIFVHVDAGFRYVGAVDAPEHSDTVRRMNEQRYLVEDLVTGRVDSAHPLAGWLSENWVTDTDLDFFATHPAHPDVMGVNYYPRHSTEVFEPGVHHSGGFADPRPTRDDGVAGLRDVLTTYAERYGAPVMVTETCVTGTVAERAEWLDASVAEVVDLKASGLPIVGYTWWPVFDMYEWTWRHSTAPRENHLLSMGLWRLSETDAGLDRVETPLVAQFRDLTTRHGGTADTPIPSTAAPSTH